MNRLYLRLLLTTVVVIVGHFTVVWVRAGYTFTVSEPSKDVAQLPNEFGQWRGEDHELDRKVAEFLNATSQVSRMYTDAARNQVSLHAAVWTQGIEDDVAPHHPAICYPNAGWTILQVERATIETPDGELPVSFCLMERAGENVVTCHWYQMGSKRFVDRTGGRMVHRALWGRAEWPPIVKVLLQTSNRDIGSARAQLDDVAARVFAWTHDIN